MKHSEAIPIRSALRCFALRALLSSGVLLAACSGTGSDHLVDTPTALIATVGYQPTSASGANPVTLTVRSGADVQLSGENSYGGNISITEFGWKQTDGASVPSVLLLYRNASTVSFTAPSVAQNVTLNFQLTVTNATGKTGTANAQVLVTAANDSNRFLSLQTVPPIVPAMPRHFRAAVSTVAGLTGLAADVPVCVQLARTVIYSPRNGAAESGSVSLPAQQVDAKWVAAAGGVAGFPSTQSGSFTNPTVSFDLPALNAEDIFALYNEPGTNLNSQLVLSDIDTAYLKMAVTATPGSCDGTLPGTALSGSQLMLQLYDEAGDAIGTPVTAAAAGGSVTIDSSLTDTALTPDGTPNLTPDDFLRAQALLPTTLQSAPTQFETRESAKAYYAALDPTGAKSTLSAWLAANCFDPNDLNYGTGKTGYSVVHADYTNNFDLGFGRDLYFSTCANGNMASIVINYPSLGAAINRVGAFLAVAMEYTPIVGGSGTACFTNPADSSTNTGACVAKFFAFAPDDRTGQYQRVLSVNFDRRGQKYLPGACTVCHGGTPHFTPVPGQQAAYPKGGDIDAAFMPWDEGSLLFSDTDPAFPCAVSSISPTCESINAGLYTKAAQTTNIRQLNALAWKTYQHAETIPAVNIDRYEALRDLLSKWYGGDPGATSAHAFDDSGTPSGWLESPQTASAPMDLYHQVFAHYCRACHTQMNGGPGIAALQMQSLTVFSLFMNPGLFQQLVFQTAQMPLSRLTDDRFWVGSSSSASAAQTLAQYVNSLPGVPAVPVDSQQHVIGPGAPIITTLNGATPLSGTAANTLTGIPGVMLDAASRSYFVGNYQWTLCPGAVPASAGSACPGELGIIGTPIASMGGGAGPAQAGAAYPAFATTVPGTYVLTLTAGSSIPGAVPPSPISYPVVIQ
jgi:cytochrome c5